MKTANARWPWALSCNLDNDTDLEIVACNNQSVWGTDNDGDALWTKALPPRSHLDLVFDIDDDGIFEVFIGVKGTPNQTAEIRILNRFGNLIKSIDFSSLRQSTSFYDVDVQVWSVLDVNSDGSLEMVLALHTAYDLYPRGIMLMGLDSGEVLWDYRCATHSTNIIFPDLDNDGVLEIVFGTSVSANGAIIPVTNTNDFNSYVIALDNDGSLRWKYKVPHPPKDYLYLHTMVSSHDLDHDGRDDIICYLGDKVLADSTEMGRVFTLDESGNLLNEYQTPFQWVRPAGQYDLDGDGNLEAIIQGDMISSERDHLAIMDLATGEIEKDVAIPDTEGEGCFIPAGLNDINGDGTVEIIVCSEPVARLSVFDSGLDLIWEHVTDRRPSVALISDIIEGGVNEIAVVGERTMLFSLDVEIEMRKVSPDEDVLHVLPGDTVQIEADVENTGEVIWLVEYSLIQRIEDDVRYLRSYYTQTPRPGSHGSVSFEWTAGTDIDELNLSVIVNITEYDQDFRYTLKELRWTVFVLTNRMISSMVNVDWDCPLKAEHGESFCVKGRLNYSLPELRERRLFSLDIALDLIRSFNVVLGYRGTQYQYDLPVRGGDFNFILLAPSEDGMYNLSINIKDRINNYNYSETRTIQVKGEKDGFAGYWVYMTVVPVILLTASGFVMYRLIRGRRILPAIPFFSREIDVNDNELRMEIYNYIQKNPGVTPRQIQNELGIKFYNTVRHHVETLENREMINVMSDPRRRRLKLCYPLNYGYSDAMYLSEASKLLLSEIRRRPRIRRRELRKSWKYSKGYLSRCLDELEEKRLINVEDSGEISLNEGRWERYRNN